MRQENLGGLVVLDLLMMPLVVHGQIAALPCLVRAHGALKGGRFPAALDHLVAAHRALPPITFPAKLTPELSLLLVRHAHVNDAQIARLGQHLERVGKYDLARGRACATAIVVSTVVAVTVPSVAHASARQNDTAPRRRTCRRAR